MLPVCREAFETWLRYSRLTGTTLAQLERSPVPEATVLVSVRSLVVTESARVTGTEPSDASSSFQYETRLVSSLEVDALRVINKETSTSMCQSIFSPAAP